VKELNFVAASPSEATHYYHLNTGCVVTWEVAVKLGIQHDCMLPLVKR
jgi:hypothetical protein